MSLSVLGSVLTFFFNIVSSILSLELVIDGFTVGSFLAFSFVIAIGLIFFRVFLGGR